MTIGEKIQEENPDLAHQLKSLKRDFRTGKLVWCCEECGSWQDVKVDKRTRQYLCRKCRKKL